MAIVPGHGGVIAPYLNLVNSDSAGQNLLKSAMSRLNLSARAYDWADTRAMVNKCSVGCV